MKLQHDFSKNSDLQEIAGYTKALRSVFLCLADATQYKAEKKMIDATELLTAIEKANEELTQVLKKKKKHLEDYYTYEDIDPSNPYKIIAGEDALLLNPSFERNLNDY